MGFAAAAATAILVIASLSSYMVIQTQEDAAADMVLEAQKRYDDRRDASAQTIYEMTRLNYVNGDDRVDIDFTNVGSTVIDLQDLEILIDGVYSSGLITTTWVDGVSGDQLLAPGQDGVVRLAPVFSNPGRILASTDNGVTRVGT